MTLFGIFSHRSKNNNHNPSTDNVDQYSKRKRHQKSIYTARPEIADRETSLYLPNYYIAPLEEAPAPLYTNTDRITGTARSNPSVNRPRPQSLCIHQEAWDSVFESAERTRRSSFIRPRLTSASAYELGMSSDMWPKVSLYLIFPFYTIAT